MNSAVELKAVLGNHKTNLKEVDRQPKIIRLVVTLALLSATVAGAQVYTVLRDFIGNDGQWPYAGLLLAGSTLYGTTQSGGGQEYGDVFKINTDGSSFAVLKSFGSLRGGCPHAELVLGDNMLYGTTSETADIGGYGTVFKLNTDGSGFAVLISYTDHTSGFEGLEQVILEGTTLYGTLAGAGSFGKVFKLNTDGSGYTVLKNFNGNDGFGPEAALVLDGSTLYGTTSYGGSSYDSVNPGYGVIFKINTDGSGSTVLKSFTGTDGRFPRTLVLSGSTLFGLAGGGGSSDAGVIFRINTDGSGFTILRSFTGTDGRNPKGLVLAGQTLYGTADGGSLNAGVVFMLGTDGSGYAVLENFDGLHGAYPMGQLAFADGTLYGTTREGGQSNFGVTFSLALTPPGPPTIVNQPRGITVHAGSNTPFDVVAVGRSPLSYQWRKDGSPISGATISMLVLTNVQVADSATYSVAVSNAAGTTLSQGAVLNVEDPFIEIQPISHFVVPGGTVNLEITAGGTQPLGYQWFKDGLSLNDSRNVSGAQSPTLTLSEANNGNAGRYWVVVSNAYGTRTSSAALLTVKPAGTVVSWGHQSMPLVPSGTRFQGVAAGYYHNLALKQDGTVVAWGDDSSGACRVPSDLNGVTSIAAGEGHSLALKQDGTIIAWGYNYYGQATVPPELSASRVIAIAAGYADSYAVKEDGTVVAWGVWGAVHNNGTLPPATAPSDLNGVIAIAAGGEHSLALKQDGTVAAWGFNSYGQTNVPSGLSGVIAIAAGFGHSMALRQDGTVVAWGDNHFGQTNVPSGLSGVVAIAASYAHSLALKQDGTLVAWGAGQTVNPSNGIDYGQSIVPSSLAGVIGIGAGYGNSLALRQDGTLVAWGRDSWDQATAPASLSGMVAVATAWDHNLALKQDGTVVAWGDDFSSPTNVPAGLGGVVAIAAGQYHSLALKGEGTVVAWGDNNSGESTVPPELSGTRVIGIAAGQLHSLALKEDGTVVAWGFNAEGQCTVPDGLGGVVAVAACYRHSLALKADGTVAAWGSDYGPGESNVPDRLGAVIAIAAGTYHNLALKRDGTVVAWGSNADGETTVPSGLNGVIAIAAGAYHSIALKQDGTVVAWGYNMDGTADVPNSLNSVIGIAGGLDHSLALVFDGMVITRPPQTQTAEAGSTVCLHVAADGFQPLTYQWFFNGINSLSVATTNALLRLSNVQPAQAGLYTVVSANSFGTVTSAPATLSVIPPVERRWVPGLILSGQPGSALKLDVADAVEPVPNWAAFDSILLTNNSQWYFDVTSPLLPQRFYRAWQTSEQNVIPALNIYMIPALSLTGAIGSTVRVDGINRFGPTDAWFPLATVTLTNTSQLYFDVSAPGQRQRLYRLVQVP